ncbi:MAG: CsgG/HfaB family protein [Treponema sp.]|nr:CsgG/HfaB family protein [Treponema sp.]MCL2251368.1 CsgG/HfaB family protein [Treponema sp.]
MIAKHSFIKSAAVLLFLFFSLQSGNAQNTNMYFTGDGGRGKKITILPIKGVGLSAEQNYLSSLVQGVLVQNMSKYSAFSVLDRVTLEKVVAETESDIYADNINVIQLGNIIQSDLMMTGSITKTSAGFLLQINVAETREGTTSASYSGSSTIADFDNFTSINLASFELLKRLGINLTERASNELSKASSQRDVQSQTVLAQGITAQRQGTQVTALSYYFQAAAIDPSLLEAVSRSNSMAEIISSGQIGDEIRNDIEQRRAWLARLIEAEEYFDNYFKNSCMWTLFYTTEISVVTINYRTEKADLRIDSAFHFNSENGRLLLNILNTITRGLNATGRRDAWGMSRWPFTAFSNKNPFSGSSKDVSVIFELLNSDNKIIGRQTFQVNLWYALRDSNGFRFASHIYNNNNNGNIFFREINADDITDDLTIRIASVNGQTPEVAARTGVLQISAVNNKTNFPR